jgi:hypothetical protein
MALIPIHRQRLLHTTFYRFSCFAFYALVGCFGASFVRYLDLRYFGFTNLNILILYTEVDARCCIDRQRKWGYIFIQIKYIHLL